MFVLYCCSMSNLCGLTLWWTCGLVVLLCGRLYWVPWFMFFVCYYMIVYFGTKGMNASLVSIESHMPHCLKGCLRKPSNGFSPVSTTKWTAKSTCDDSVISDLPNTRLTHGATTRDVLFFIWEADGCAKLNYQAMSLDFLSGMHIYRSWIYGLIGLLWFGLGDGPSPIHTGIPCWQSWLIFMFRYRPSRWRSPLFLVVVVATHVIGLALLVRWAGLFVFTKSILLL
jgi:hypothetical protein